MAADIRAVIALDGEKEFRQAVTNANSSLNTLKSSVGLVDAQFKGQQNTLEALTAKHDALSKAVDASKQKEESLRSALNNAQASYDKIGKGLQTLNKQYDEEVKKLDQMKASGTASNEELEKQEKVVNDLSGAIKQGEQNYQSAENRVNKWQTSLNKAETETINLNDKLDQNDKYMAEAQKSTDKCASSIDGYGKQVKGATTVTTSFGEKLKAAFAGNIVTNGINLIKDGVKALGNAFKEVVSTGSEFEAAMSQVEAISGATGNELDQLTAKAQEMGQTTKYTATEAAEALQYMSLAGWETQEMIDGLDGVLNLAAASNMDLATASDIVTDYLSAFNMEASQSEELVDKMAYAMSNSNTTTEQLGEAYKNVAATSTQLGYSLDDTTSALMVMADSGIKGGEAGTALSSIMTRLGNNTSGCADMLRDYGIEVYDANGKARSLTEILGDMQGMWAGLTDEEKSNVAYTIAGRTAQTELMTVLGESTGSLEEYTAGLADCNGVAADMAETMQDNFAGATTRLGSAVDGLQTQLFGFVEGPLTSLANGAASVINGITEALTHENSEMEDFTDSVRANVDEVSTALEKIQGDVDDMTAGADDLEAYENILLRLNEEEELDAYQKYQLQNIIEALSDSVPGLTEAFDEESGTLSLTNDELKDMIDSSRNLSEVATMQDALSRAETEQEKAAIELGKAQDALSQAQENYGDVMTDTAVATGVLSDEQKQAVTDQTKAAATVAEAQKAYDDAAAAVEDYKDQLDELEDAVGDVSDVTGEADDALGEHAQTWQEVSDSIQTSAEAEEEACQNILDAYHDMADSIAEDIAGDTIDLTKKFDAGDSVSVDEMQANLDSQIEAMQTYNENMQTLVSTMGNDISPEFLKYIQDMGMDGAAMLQEMVDTLAEEGGAEKLKNLSDSYEEALDWTDATGEVMAANQIAYEQSLGELGSTEVEFEGLRNSIDTAVSEAAENWEGLDDATREALEQTIQTAEDCGVQIPQGLASAIESGEESPEQAIADIKGAISGQFEGLVQIAEANGIEIPAELQAGIESGGQAAVDSFGELCSLMSASTANVGPEAEAGGEEIGSSVTSGASSGIEDGTGDVVSASEDMADEAAESAVDELESHESEFEDEGTASGEAYADGIGSQASNAMTQAQSMASQALSGVQGYKSDFYTAGSEVASGYRKGIEDGTSKVASAARKMAVAAYDAVQAVNDSHSPSKKFKKAADQAVEGYAEGFNENDKAIKASGNMAKSVYKEATSWLKDYKSTHKVSLQDEKYYWQEVLDTCHEGTTSYTKALSKYTDTVAKIVKSGVSKKDDSGARKDTETYYSDIYNAAKDYMDRLQVTSDVSLEEQLSYWESVQKQVKKGTQAWYDAQKQINSLAADMSGRDDNLLSSAENTLDKIKIMNDLSLDAEIAYWENILGQTDKYSDAWYEITSKINDLKSGYYDEMYNAASDYANKMSILDSWSAADELAYWEAVQAEMEKGTDAWYNAQKQINSIKSRIGTVSNMSSLLSAYTTYYELSAQAEVQYWDTVRQQYQEGTEERLEADQYYFEAKKEYEKQLEDLEDDYLAKVKDVDKQLESDIKSLTDSYESQLNSLVSQYKSAFNLFDEFTSESVSGEQLLFNLQSQAAGYEAWSEALDDLADRGILSDELLQELTDQGPDQLAALYALMDLTDEDLMAYQDAFDRKMTAIQTQAEKDSADLLADVEAQTAELTAQAEQDKQDLLDEYNSDLASVNQTISSELLLLAQNTQDITEDQTAALVAAIEGGTKSVTEALSASKTSASAAGATGTSVASTATSGGSSDSGISASMISGVLDLINKGTEKTSLTASQRSKYSDLCVYLVDNYGRFLSTTKEKNLAKYIGVDTSTSGWKKRTLTKLNEMGFRQGGRPDDDLVWMDEELDSVGPELTVSRSDNALLTRIPAGSEIIDAGTTSNLLRLSQIDPDQLMDVLAKQQTIAMSTLNSLNTMGSAQINDLAATNVQPVEMDLDISGLADRLAEMEDVLTEYLPYLAERQNLYLDSGKLVGGLSDDISTDMAARSRRRRVS